MKSNTLKKALLSVAVTAASFGTLSSVNAATLDVDVDITLPDVIILYAYTDIDLSLAANQLGPLLDTACTTDDCSNAFAATQTDTLSTFGTLDLNLAADVAPAAGTNPTVTLDNSWGVRGLGFNTYTETITAGVGNEVLNLTIENLGAPTLALQTGSVSFDINLSNPDADADGVIEANYTITVVGT